MSLFDICTEKCYTFQRFRKQEELYGTQIRVELLLYGRRTL